MSLFRKSCMALLLAMLSLNGCDHVSEANRHENPSAKENVPSTTGQARGQHQQEQADAQLASIKRRLASGGSFTPELVDALRTLHREVPLHLPTIELLTSAYVQREDWNSLVDLLQSRSAAQRSDKEQLQIATILIKAQRFPEAYEVSNAVLQKAGRVGNEQAAWLAAYAAFHSSGNRTRAAEIIDANFASMIAAGRQDAYVIRALIHFQEGEFEQAESLLTTLLDQNASHAPAHDALGRVLVASGDVERGRYHIERASELRDQLTQTERKSLRLAAMSQSLKAAWGSKDYETCDRLITAMLNDASPQQQVKLYQHLAALRAAQGRKQEAVDAMERAKKISTMKPSQ